MACAAPRGSGRLEAIRTNLVAAYFARYDNGYRVFNRFGFAPVTLRRKREHSYHHNDLRNALLEEALVILRDEGDANFTLRDLARRVGVSHAAPYAHFADRRALLAAVAVRGYEGLCAAMSEARARAATPLEAFGEMGVAYVLFGWKHPAHYRLMFQAPELAKADDLPELRAAEATAYAMLDETVRFGHRAGFVTSGDPTTDSIVSWSHVHGMTSLLIDRHEFLGVSSEEEVVALTRAAIERLLTVFLPAAQPARGLASRGA